MKWYTCNFAHEFQVRSKIYSIPDYFSCFLQCLLFRTRFSYLFKFWAKFLWYIELSEMWRNDPNVSKVTVPIFFSKGLPLTKGSKPSINKNKTLKIWPFLIECPRLEREIIIIILLFMHSMIIFCMMIEHFRDRFYERRPSLFKHLSSLNLISLWLMKR